MAAAGQQQAGLQHQRKGQQTWLCCSCRACPAPLPRALPGVPGAHLAFSALLLVPSCDMAVDSSSLLTSPRSTLLRLLHRLIAGVLGAEPPGPTVTQRVENLKSG